MKREKEREREEMRRDIVLLCSPDWPQCYHCKCVWQCEKHICVFSNKGLQLSGWIVRYTSRIVCLLETLAPFSLCNCSLYP